MITISNKIHKKLEEIKDLIIQEDDFDGYDVAFFRGRLCILSKMHMGGKIVTDAVQFTELLNLVDPEKLTKKNLTSIENDLNLILGQVRLEKSKMGGHANLQPDKS